MLGKHRRVRESKNPQNVIRVALTENYGEIGKALVNLSMMVPRVRIVEDMDHSVSTFPVWFALRRRGICRLQRAAPFNGMIRAQSQPSLNGHKKRQKPRRIHGAGSGGRSACAPTSAWRRAPLSPCQSAPQAFAGDALEAFRTLSMVRLRQRFLPQYARASMLGPVCAPMTGPMSAMWGSAWGN